MRATLWLCGQPLFEVEVTLGEDGGRVVDVPAPVQTGVSGMADTALGEQSDPDTRVSGFGLPLRPDAQR